MVRRKFKWKFAVFFYLILLNVFTKSKPIGTHLNLITTSDTLFSELVIPSVTVVNEEDAVPSTNLTSSTNVLPENVTHNALLRNAVRPGQTVFQYDVDITVHPGGDFDGLVLMAITLTDGTQEDAIVFHVEGLDIQRVYGGTFNIEGDIGFSFSVDDGLLEIEPERISNTYRIGIEYTGSIRNDGNGLFQGEFNDINYLAMNLHPTNARRVFPCMDEPEIETIIRFNFHDIEYNNIVMNSMLEENSQSDFVSLSGPPHRWGMVAHNFNAMLSPVVNVFLYGRPGLSGQESQASVFINFYYNALNEWTDKPYLEIIVGQDGRMHIIALPDTSRDWYALSTVCIWEPYMFMETIHSAKQRKLSFVKIAEAMARQWFGYVIYPINWRYQWVITGFGKYAAYEAIRSFQENSMGTELLIDANTVFVTDIIQESLLQDAYLEALPLELEEDLLDEEPIRDYINGILNYKAPALMWLMRLVMGGDDDDVIQRAARNLLHWNSQSAINTAFFRDALGDALQNTELVDDVEDFLEPWLQNNGYPLLHVSLRPGGVLVMQERFGFSTKPQVSYSIPITFTTSTDMNFDNIYPTMVVDGTTTLDMSLGEEDFVLFNLQGQGYYRVNYDADLWERIIEALNDPERREEIHPLNRATLVDDALNCARAGRLDYDIAFQIVLSMEHETEYAVWKAFVRNMDFLRKRLVSYVDDDEDLDPDIYLRMVRRTVGLVESEIGFYPDPMINEPAMVSLTRGLVMDHACRANYQPCIAAAVDWFYDPNNAEHVVNPNIPHDIRPAVYCTMVREGDDQVIAALYARLEIEPTLYERVVILESLACSEDEGFINILLQETIAANSPYTVEERSRIFAAIAESSYDNARRAASFMSMRTIEIRNSYGGPEKLEELLFVLADNMADGDLSNDFNIWINNINSNLDDSLEIAKRAAGQVRENLQWDINHMEYVYEWIDLNDAHALVVSLVLVCVPFMLALFNH